MKRIGLVKLTLKDFQGGTFTFEPDGEDTDVYGYNKSGKTRLASAFSYLLFGKDSLNRADFEIKNLNAEGEAEHNLDHIVEGALDVDGENVTLKKCYREKWSRKKGNPKAEFSGHTTDHFIDGVPVAEKDYKSKINEIAGDEETFRLLTNPIAFAALHWSKQRSILLDVVGNLSDQDVIDSNPGLMELPAILGKKTLDDYRKIITSRKTEINKELERLPVRVDECKRGIPDISGLNKTQIEKDIATTEIVLNDIKLKLQGIKTGGKIAEIGNEIASLNIKIRQLESDHYSYTMKSAQEMGQKISEITSNITKADRNAQDIRDQVRRKTEYADSIQKQLDKIDNEGIQWKSKEFQDVTKSICPACGQYLPTDKVQDARDKALAEFNFAKAEKIKELRENWHKANADLERIEADIQLLETEALVASNEAEKQKESLPELQTTYDTAKRIAEDYTGIPLRIELLNKKTGLEAALKSEQEGVSVTTETLNKDILGYEQGLITLKSDLDRFARRESGEKRIAELLIEEKKLATEYEKLEKEMYLTDLFVTTKVNLLTERINNSFEIVRFKLFEVQVNGAIDDKVCEMTVAGVGYNVGLNSAAKVQGGLDIIRTLQRHYGILAPVIIDNRESTIDIPKMSCQVISLIVSASDPVLRIERSREAVMV